jgi:hypothetical protein
MLSTFTRGTVLLPNDDVLPTTDASTECFEENLLSNGALLPNSAHMSVSFLYQFLVLTMTSASVSTPSWSVLTWLASLQSAAPLLLACVGFATSFFV